MINLLKYKINSNDNMIYSYRQGYNDDLTGKRHNLK